MDRHDHLCRVLVRDFVDLLTKGGGVKDKLAQIMNGKSGHEAEVRQVVHTMSRASEGLNNLNWEGKGSKKDLKVYQTISQVMKQVKHVVQQVKTLETDLEGEEQGRRSRKKRKEGELKEWVKVWKRGGRESEKARERERRDKET